MDDRSVIDQVVSGLRLCAIGLLGFVTIGMFWGGITAVTTPEEVGRSSFLFRTVSVGTHSIPAAWICLAVSSAILIATMDRWVKVLPGFFAYSTFGALLMLFSGRYNRMPVSWHVGLFLTIFGISTTLISFTFQKRQLRLIDRVALMGFQACLPLGATKDVSSMFKAFTAAFVFLFVAWAVDRARRDRADRSFFRDQLYNSAAGDSSQHKHPCGPDRFKSSTTRPHAPPRSPGPTDRGGSP